MNFKRLKDACQDYKVCRNTLMRYANEAGAASWLGRLVYIDCDVMDEYIRDHLGNVHKRKEGVRA